jgi:hypothetical protein
MTPPRRIQRNGLSEYFMHVWEKHHGFDAPLEDEDPPDFYDDHVLPEQSELPEEEP